MYQIYTLYQSLGKRIGYLPGDCMIAAAFMSYLGPFLSNYREIIVKKTWIPQVCILDTYVTFFFLVY